jgi:UDP-N-acetylglucosamine 2-epimerase (non-hydrolysing)/GDP/UDP-N,N'-diacetylbacillosamine 2-epimerase (hydrolysing)
MGEEEWRVHWAGAPSLDHLRRQQLLSREQLESLLNVNLQRPSVLVAYHPVTMARNTLQEMDAMFAALSAIPEQVLFCYPNADAGSRELAARAEDFLATRNDGRIWTNLHPVTYWSLLRCVDLFVGNSSSGIMETPSFALPTVNIGIRQKGRERAPNVLDAEASTQSILEKIGIARRPEFRQSLIGMTNPYGEGDASAEIVRVLAETPISPRLFFKQAPLATNGLQQNENTVICA